MNSPPSSKQGVSTDCLDLHSDASLQGAALRLTSGREDTLTSQSVAHLSSKLKGKQGARHCVLQANKQLPIINMRRQQQRPTTAMRARLAAATARHPRSLLPTLLSLAYFTASSTTAFLLTPPPARPTPISSSSLHREQSATRCRTSTSRQPHPLSCSTRQISTAPWSSNSRTRTTAGSSRGGGVSALRSVAAPAGLEKVSGLNELLYPRNGVSERFVFFGGKGGVGKTSTAAAVAIQCADAGLR